MFRKTNAIAKSGSNDNIVIDLIEREATRLEIPNYITKIGNSAFNGYTTITEIIIPNSVTSIGNSAFASTNFEYIEIPSSVTVIGSSAFYGSKVKSVKLNEGLETIGSSCFLSSQLETINIPTTTAINSTMFSTCTKLKNVTLGIGFNKNNLNLSVSTLYTAETIVSWLEALADRTGQATYKLTIGTTNLAKLTTEQIAIATAKNWTLA